MPCILSMHDTNKLSAGITLVDGPKKPLSHPFAPREECINYEDYFMDKVQVSSSSFLFYIFTQRNGVNVKMQDWREKQSDMKSKTCVFLLI